MAYLYFTTTQLTKESAGAVRIISFCRVLQDLGKEVIVVSLDNVAADTIHLYKEVNYTTIRSLSNGFISRAFNYIFYKKRVKRCVYSLNETYRIEGLFFYDIPAPAIEYLKTLAAERNIKLFHDSVEWYSPEQFKLGVFALPYILKNLLNRYIIDKKVNVVAISSFLQNYFQLKGINTLRIPIMMDMNEISHDKLLSADKLRLFYAGSPGKKDYLKEIILGLSQLRKDELEQVELQLLGITAEQLKEVCLVPEGCIEQCGASLIVRGRVSRDVVLEQLRTADFTVLLRSPNLRYAKAGFPTKVVESLATGTPVICNITSDLGNYLVDGQNCLIVSESSPQAFVNTLRRALMLTHQEKQNYCINARLTAEREFDYRKFKDEFSAFL